MGKIIKFEDPRVAAGTELQASIYEARLAMRDLDAAMATADKKLAAAYRYAQQLCAAIEGVDKEAA